MNADTYEQVSATAAEKLSEPLEGDRYLRRQLRRELAAETVRAELAQMEAAGRVLQLTEEEIRLLRAFRRFKSTLKKAGKCFRWQTVPLEADVLLVDGSQSIHIIDPQDVSETVSGR